ncbi:hypothetical protein M8I34_32315 [Streptomyces sp. MCA2]|uniref:hypothetical protein n=1 Tax=Streptomyces sp. MCA2 TaxID=2944805 RepID=UPI0020207673|nr:hypothetical protein [Streptomyces sp. MCA2]MCL7496054.1 hypothetical protein [Streptomyces sp. MCA2]
MIALPLFLFAGLGTYVSWRMDSRPALLVCALLCGYALATSPLASAIDAFGTGINNALSNASHAK